MIDDSKKNIISLDKWMGSIIGLAVGDQLGSLTEGKTRGSFEKVRGMDPGTFWTCLLYTSPSPRDRTRSRMPSSA